MAYKPTSLFNFLPKKEKGDDLPKISYWLKKLYEQEEQKSTEQKEEKENHGLSRSHPRLYEDKSPSEMGMEEHLREKFKKAENDKLNLEALTRKSDRCILSISSVFPWTFFSDSIEIEESKVIFIFRQFMSSQTQSIDLKDISNVLLHTGFFFSTLEVVSRTFVLNDIKIGHLKKNEAEQARRIIEALRIYVFRNIDTSNYEKEELREKLEALHTER